MPILYNCGGVGLCIHTKIMKIYHETGLLSVIAFREKRTSNTEAI